MSIAKNRAELSSEEKRALLAELLWKKADKSVTTHPLSSAQYGLCFQHNFAPESVAFNIMYALRIWSELHIPALRRSFQVLVDRHATLRTTYAVQDGQQVQHVHARQEICFTLLDAAGWSWEQLVERMLHEADQPFDLASGPILRVHLFTTAADQSILLMTIHHIAVDLWSLDMIMDELRLLYAAERAGTAAGLPALEVQYTDYVYWQAQLLREQGPGSASERLWSYWRRQLAGELPALQLPTDRPRPPIQTYPGAARTLKLSAALSGQLKALAQAEGVTLYMLLLAAYQVVLQRYSGQDDYLLGSPSVIRDRPELAGVVGCFVNYVALRADLAGNPSFKALLGRVRQMALGALEHQAYPFNQLVEQLQIARDASRFPLFQHVFIWDKLRQIDEQDVSPFLLMGLNETSPRMQWDGIEVEALAYDQRGAAFDVMLTVFEGRDTLAVSLKYNTDLFDADTVERLLEHFHNVLGGIVAAPGQPISALPLLSAAERQRMLYDFNATEASYPADSCIHELFEAQVARTPHAVAVAYDGQTLSYQELNQQANQLARRLVTLGVGPGSLVAIYMERTPDLIVALLGVLKAGGAYVPQEPGFPSARVQWILNSLGVRHLITQHVHLPKLPAFCPPTLEHVICLDQPLAVERAAPGLDDAVGSRQVWTRADLRRDSTENLPPRAAGDDLAYIIFTSGSTGTPKGVMIQHAPVVNLIDWVNRRFAIGATDRVLFVTSVCFDLSVYDIFGLLAAGGSIQVVPNRDLGDPQRLIELLYREPVTFWDSAPAALQQLAPLFPTLSGDERTSHLRLAFLSGDWIPVSLPDAVRRAFPDVQVVSLGGATEATVWSNYYPIGEVDPQWPSIPYGQPIQNAQYHILDQRLNPCPIGVAGDLYIAGLCLAAAYSNEPMLTAEKFIPNPFAAGRAAEIGSRLYKTGDRARYWVDGTMEFLGRIDQQVKLRGYRIELGEIEAALRQHPAVYEAVVMVREDTPGNRRLAAYVVAQPGSIATGGELQTFLKAAIPDYMVPAAIVLLENLPATANGKLDRRALPSPESLQPQLEESYVAPRTPAEALAAAIWAEVLQVQQVGAHDNFFALGGHSLLATQTVLRLQEAFKTPVSLRMLFEAPTLAELAERLATPERDPDLPAPAPIMPCSQDEPIPASFAQERMWFLEQLTPGTIAYNVPFTFVLNGALDVGALQQSLTQLAARHSSLRTTFALHAGQLTQRLHPPRPVPLPLVDLSAHPPARQPALVQQHIAADAQLPFDLQAGPLVRATLLRQNPSAHVLLLTFHHSVFDAWSLGVVAADLSALYSAARHGRPAALPALPIQYADYAVWQRQQLAGPRLARHLAYWRQQLAAAPPRLALPTDRPRPPVQQFAGALHPFTLPPALSAALQALAQREGVTLFMTLLAAFQVLLSRLSGQTDLVVGVPVANRTPAETAGLVGLFINTLPLRVALADQPRFTTLLARVRETCLDAFAQQALPFEQLVEAVQPERDPSYAPIYQVLFDLHNTPPPQLTLDAVQAQLLPLPQGIAKFDLTLTMRETADGLTGEWEYSTALFEAATIGRLAAQFTTLLAALTARPTQRVSVVELLPAEQAYELLVARNATATAYPEDRTVAALVSAQAARTPDAPALVYGPATLSYAALDARAAQLAHALQQHGVRPGDRVVVCVERGLELVIAILAIWQAGAAFVPLDPAFPAERITQMVADADLVLTQQHLRARLPLESPPVLCLEHAAMAQHPIMPPRVIHDAEQVAYVIYTSGSTGRPKGVAVAHRALVNFLTSMQRTLSLSAADSLLAVTTISFDIAGLELFLPLIAGARVVIASAEEAMDGAHLAGLLKRSHTTVMQATPATWRLLLSAGWQGSPDLTVLCGGEALAAALAAELRTRCKTLWNMYGPTETTIWSAAGQVSADALLPVAPIGPPIANTQLYVLDMALAPAPIGVVGELYIGGAGLAHGYVGQMALTAERFIPDPFAAAPGARLYRTGDLVRQRADRTIEFLGRNDQQVKVRGYRIELGEIEQALGAHPALRQAVVVARPDSSGQIGLVGYITADGAPPTITALRQWLQDRLPTYMIPAAFVVLEQLPLTLNGKVDRRALPEPEAPSELRASYVAARTPTEQALSELWAEVLHLERVGIHDNFFALGGHSLLLAQLIGRIRETLHVELPLRAMFSGPTIAELTQQLDLIGWVLESEAIAESAEISREEFTI